MVVMVVVGSWVLGHLSTVGIVHIFCEINLLLGLKIYASINSIHPVQTGQIKFIIFRIRFILG